MKSEPSNYQSLPLRHCDGSIYIPDTDFLKFLISNDMILTVQPKWIKVEDELPKNKERFPGETETVLIANISGQVTVGYYSFPDEMWCFDVTYCYFSSCIITHWMPLPEAPKCEPNEKTQ